MVCELQHSNRVVWVPNPELHLVCALGPVLYSHRFHPIITHPFVERDNWACRRTRNVLAQISQRCVA